MEQELCEFGKIELMRLLHFIIIFSFITSISAHSYERSDAFIVKVFDKKIKVLAPSKYDPKLNVIVENKTLMKSISKLERTNGKVVKYISVEAGKFTSIKLKAKKGEIFYLVPISPPFQKVELITGRKPYEIPPQR